MFTINYNNMKFNLLAVLFIVTVLPACSVMKMQTAKTMDIYGAGVLQMPVVAELLVSEKKITGSAKLSGESLEVVKQQAIANAIKIANADILVEPTFETEDKGGSITVTVTGFPAVYKNFRSIEHKDLELMKAGIVQKAETFEPVEPKKKKGVGIFIAIIAVASVVFGILATVL